MTESGGKPPYSDIPDLGLRKLAFAFSAGKLAGRVSRLENTINLIENIHSLHPPPSRASSEITASNTPTSIIL